LFGGTGVDVRTLPDPADEAQMAALIASGRNIQTSPPQRLRARRPASQYGLRRRRFQLVLEESGRLRATQTRDHRSPRMVKRRNSPYKSRGPTVATRVPIDSTPQTLPAKPDSAAAPNAKTKKPRSPGNPRGGPVI
jgi:hypothetical protein